ncbi:hypothetical protein H4R27_001444 [Coemansia aciculifera]|nr:hypothetical protein H4R27_001444 [Coemansia aciculifera]
MLLSLLATVLALLTQLALGADDSSGESSDDSGKVAVNQIDLLGGTTGLVALTAALIQILPSPVQLCERRLQQFLDWLKSSIEDDFCVSLYTCTNRCHTQTYEPNSESMRRRILTSIGEADSVGCIGNEHLSVDELVTVIQTGNNAQTLLELAELARYPEMGKLRRVIRTVYYSPTNGRSVIVVQWMGFLFCALAYWLVSTGIPPAWRQFWRVVFNLVRRIRGLTPIHGSAERKTGLDYRMADLARHRTLFQNVPWIRYALYYMLTNMANRQLSARSWSVDERKANDDSKPSEPNESSPVFGHAMLGERRLVTRMATDECSAARLLYSNALHSLRVILLCEAVAYVPPYLLTSSFRMVRRKLAKTMLVATHSDLDAVYRALLGEVGGDYSPSANMLRANTSGTQAKHEACGRAYIHAAYDLLLKRLQSKLGRQITSGCEVYVLLNLTLLPLHLSTGIISVASFTSSAEPPQYEIEGVQIPDEQLRKLIAGRDTTGAFILELLTLFKSTDIYWGSTIWLLYMLRTVYGNFSETDLTASDEESGASTFMTIRAELKLLCFSPFQPRFGVPGSDIPDHAITRRHDLYVPLGHWDVLSDNDYCNSVPAWCTCTGHCPGICTLIVNELDMNILMTRYFTTPYAFRMSFPRGAGPAGVLTTLRLVCATNWDVEAQYALLKLKEYKSSNTQQPSGNPSGRLDSTTFDLSDILYSKAAVVVVIHGGEILVHKLNADVANGRWPLNLECRPLEKKLLNEERIIVPKVIALKLEPVDAFTEQVGKEITLSDSRLRYMVMQAAKTQRLLGKPFRSHGPMSKAA